MGDFFMKAIGKIGVVGGFLIFSMVGAGCASAEYCPKDDLHMVKNAYSNAAWCEAPEETWLANSSFKGQSGRKQSFSVILALNVAGKTDIAVKDTVALAEKYSGNMIYASMAVVQVKIPCNKSDDFLAAVEKLGNVSNRSISAKDVTDEYTDVELRCKNLRSLRDRYEALLAKAVKVEDMLKIEKELSRVTQELERYLGRLKVLKNSVEMVTFDISFNTVYVGKDSVPVDWIRSIGNDINKENNKLIDEFDADVEMPEGFVTVYSNDSCMIGVNSDNTAIQMRSYDDLPGATAEFYQKFVCKQLAQKGYADIEVKKLTLSGKSAGFSVTAASSGKSYTAAVVLFKDGLICKQNKVLLIELQGKTKDVKQVDFKKMTGSLKLD